MTRFTDARLRLFASLMFIALTAMAQTEASAQSAGNRDPDKVSSAGSLPASIGSPSLDNKFLNNPNAGNQDRPTSSGSSFGDPPESNSLLDDFARTFQQAADVAGQKRAFAVRLNDARQKYFVLYPDKRGIEEARQTLASLLAEIDLYYLSQYVAAGMSDAEIARVAALDRATGGPLGGGISYYAQGAFRLWIDRAREAMGAIPRDKQAGGVNALTGVPLANGTGQLRLSAECSKPVVFCNQTMFVPTQEGYIEGVRESIKSYEYYMQFRDRLEISNGLHVSLESLPPISSPPPVTPEVISDRLISEERRPFDTATLGGNNFQAAQAGGSLLPTGGLKWTTYQQVVSSIVQNGSYQTLNCFYGPRKAYYFWAKQVPPNFAQLAYAVTRGGMIGDAARLGTKTTTDCPATEALAKQRQAFLLDHLDRPVAGVDNQNIYIISHDRVGAVSGTGNSYQNWENVVDRKDITQFAAEIDNAIADKQKVLECDYHEFGTFFPQFYWYKHPPENLRKLMGLIVYDNGIIMHMGTSARETCPATYRDSIANERKLGDEISALQKQMREEAFLLRQQKAKEASLARMKAESEAYMARITLK